MSEQSSRTPPPHLNPVPPSHPLWPDLPTDQQEELLRHLGRMLTERLAAPDAAQEAAHEPR